MAETLASAGSREFGAADDLPVLVGQGESWPADRGPFRTPVDQRSCVAVRQQAQCSIDWDDAVAFFGFEPKNFCLGPADGIAPNDGAIENADPLGGDAFDADIKRARLACGFDPGFDQADIFIEDRVLKRDPQRKNAVQPALDRGQIVSQFAAFGFQLKSGQ